MTIVQSPVSDTSFGSKSIFALGNEVSVNTIALDACISGRLGSEGITDSMEQDRCPHESVELLSKLESASRRYLVSLDPYETETDGAG